MKDIAGNNITEKKIEVIVNSEKTVLENKTEEKIENKTANLLQDIKEENKKEKKKSKKQPSRIKFFFYRKLIKINRFYKSLFTEDETSSLTEYQIKSLKLVNILISDKQSTILVSPLSDKRFIKSRDVETEISNQLHIILDNYSATIINHKYSYDVDFPHKTYQKLILDIDKEIERRRRRMENEIRKNITHSLDIIIKNYETDKPKEETEV